MTERQLRELREQWDKAHSRWQAAKYCLSIMQTMTEEMHDECKRLAELIAEHDDTEIVITEDDGDAT